MTGKDKTIVTLATLAAIAVIEALTILLHPWM